MGIGGTSLLFSVIVAPLGFLLEISAMRCAILGVISNYIKRPLKAKKHDEIRVLAESKLNSLSDFISTTLTDNEFSIILKEIEKFRKMKTDIRTKSAKLTHVDNLLDKKKETEKALIKKGWDEARISFIQKLT